MKLYFRNLRSFRTSCKHETQERNVIKQNEKEGKKKITGVFVAGLRMKTRFYSSGGYLRPDKTVTVIKTNWR